jgi:hypothetical protein
MTEPSRIRDARRECEEYGAIRGAAMSGPGRRAHRATRVRALCPTRRAPQTRRAPLPTRPHGAIVSGHMISRRGFLVGSVTLLAAPLAAEAQNLPRIGLISIGADPSRPVVWLPFLERLRELGYVEGGNITIERRFAAGRPERLDELVTDLAHLRVDNTSFPDNQCRTLTFNNFFSGLKLGPVTLCLPMPSNSSIEFR